MAISKLDAIKSLEPNAEFVLVEDEITVLEKKEIRELEVYQCQDCFTIYDEAFGDKTQNIPENTLFSELSEDYVCSLCEAPKKVFRKKVLIK